MTDSPAETPGATPDPEQAQDAVARAANDDHVNRAVEAQARIGEHCEAIENLRQTRDHEIYLAVTDSGLRPAHVYRAMAVVSAAMDDPTTRVSESTVRNAVRDGKRAAARAARAS